MSNIINLEDRKKQEGKYEVTYIMDENDRVVGVTHPKWPFRIQRQDNEIALVSECDDEPFGILDREVFNTILICWLLIDQPDAIAPEE